MSDPPRPRDTKSDTGPATDRGGPAGMPTWVKVAGIIVGILVLALVAIMLIVGGNHGADRHPAGDQPTQQSEPTAPDGETPGGNVPSAWDHE